MKSRIRRPPDFEVQAAASARELRFRVVADAQTSTDGTARLATEAVSERRNLPEAPVAGVRYRGVRVAGWFAAWLPDD